MGSAGMKQQQGEKRSDYIARVQAAQREEAAARPQRTKARRKPRAWDADRTPFGQGDNLGLSHD